MSLKHYSNFVLDRCPQASLNDKLFATKPLIDSK